jgi:exopolyphosphatase/guanosine-5'-triphosphate,3'-diphosphate pyrophosphatase
VAGGRVIAVIDVGSNSVRLLVARELSDAAFEVVDEQRFDARLGEGQAGGELTAQGFERGLMAMRIMSQVAASHGPSITLAAGTEALRRATKADAFVDAVHDQTGLAIRVLSAEEEAAASFLGVVNSSRITSGHVLDLGGGSLELMDVGVRFLTGAQSAPLGAIYASERYLKSDPPAPKEVRALRRAVRQQLEIDSTEGELWGVGGAVRNIARIVRPLAPHPRPRDHAPGDDPPGQRPREGERGDATPDAGRLICARGHPACGGRGG